MIPMERLMAALVLSAVLVAAGPIVAHAGTTSAAAVGTTETGKIAWYGSKFNGRRTASGQRYNSEALTMAHKTLPFGTHVKVTNPSNGKHVIVRVNDRGPAQADRVGDVSHAAARRLGMTKHGVIDAQLEVVEGHAAH